MQAIIRQVGNSKAVLLPRVFLKQMGLDDTVEMTMEGDSIVLRKPAKALRVGWSEASKKLCAADDGGLLMPDFVNEDDSHWVW